jgi:hypothetical protein
MSYNVNIKEKEDHLRVEISGEWTIGDEAEEVISAWSQVIEICKTKKINHILAIGNVIGKLTPMAAYDIANFPDKHGWSREFRVAVVALGESWKSNLFGETVAENRGYTLKVFDNEQDAKIWLLES